MNNVSFSKMQHCEGCEIRCYNILGSNPLSWGCGSRTLKQEEYRYFLKLIFRRVVDPHWFNTVRIWIRIQIQGFDDQKLENIYSWEFFRFIFFISKIAIYLSLVLPKDAQATGEAFNP